MGSEAGVGIASDSGSEMLAAAHTLSNASQNVHSPSNVTSRFAASSEAGASLKRIAATFRQVGQDFAQRRVPVLQTQLRGVSSCLVRFGAAFEHWQ